MTTGPGDERLTALVAAARAGERRALETLLREHYDDVYRVARRLCSHHHDAQDAAQNAMIGIARGIATYDGRAAFSTWVYRITVNACTDELRRRSRRPVPDEQLSDGSRDTAPGRQPLNAVSPHQPESEALRAEQRRELNAALAELPEEFRIPVVLRDVAGLDYAQIAEVLDIPAGTVRSRISRGRRHLATALSGNRSTARDVKTMNLP